MTATPGHGEPRHHIVIVGAGAAARSVRDALRAGDGTSGDVAVLDDEIVGSVFDDADSSWLLDTAGGDVVRADVVVDAGRPVFLPWLPDLAGRSDFRGESFAAAAWNPDFDPAGKRIAVVGTDAAVGHQLGALVESAATVTAFAHAPRRFVTDWPRWNTRAKRWLARRSATAPQPAVALVRTAIDAVTSSGIRTADGVDHPADVVIYGTGCTLAEHVDDRRMVGTCGLSLRQTWDDGQAPFFGVAVHGFPNYFFITGPDADTQIRYVAQCLALMGRTGSRRIEVRRSSQQVHNERAHLGPAAPPAALGAFEAFDLSGCVPADADVHDTYDGAATLELAGTRHSVRVRLRGHLDPLDGNYHWQGMVLDTLPAESVQRARTATLSVGRLSAAARIVERTPWGTHSVAGVGAPPYPRNSA